MQATSHPNSNLIEEVLLKYKAETDLRYLQLNQEICSLKEEVAKSKASDVKSKYNITILYCISILSLATAILSLILK